MRNRRGLVILFSLLVLIFGMQCSLLSIRGKAKTQPGVQPQPVNPQPAAPDNPVQPDNPNLPGDNNNQNGAGPIQIAGMWESQTDTQLGTMVTELILEHTGTFSQQVTLGDLLTYDVGTYAVGEGFIRFIVENHEPKTYKGQQMHWLTSFTYFYTVVDSDTMIFEDRVAGTQWTVHRR